MGFLNERPMVAYVASFFVGLILGWMVLGWGLFPVQYTVEGATGVAGIACTELGETEDPAQQAILNNMAMAQNGTGCANYVPVGGVPTDTDAVVTDPNATDPNATDPNATDPNATSGDAAADAAPVEEEGGSSLGTFLIVFLLLAAVGGLLYMRRQREALGDGEETSSRPSWQEEIPDDMTAVGATGGSDTIPIARFRTTYSLGHDTYDDSFSIENKAGDFLGECGVSIAESIGTDSPKNVTAFEVWLFDKNDIRTITKVVMSDHAFFDDALKAKLKPKGEPFLAKENETIVLETAALIINAEITDMQYGEGTAPPQSFFDSITIELSAWAKDEEVDGPDLEARAEQLKMMGDY